MEQDLLKAFDASKGNFALVATYDFDPVYFERRILPQDGFNGAERIIILMDKGRYQERLNNQEFMATGFNRQYLVIPVSRARGVFHPKLYLVLGEKKITAVIGSNNCTGAGTAYNMELCSVFSLSISEKETGNKDTRKVENSNDPVIPFGFVLSFVRKNIELLIGDLGNEENQPGYIAAIKENIRSDPEIIKNRLVTENVPAMIVAAIDVVIEVRALALKKGEGDSWSSKHRLEDAGPIILNRTVQPPLRPCCQLSRISPMKAWKSTMAAKHRLNI